LFLAKHEEDSTNTSKNGTGPPPSVRVKKIFTKHSDSTNASKTVTDPSPPRQELKNFCLFFAIHEDSKSVSKNGTDPPLPPARVGI
jgi:hypothetical protein